MKDNKLCIDGNEVTFLIEEKDIYEIEFYPNNPRIATIVDSLEEKTEKAIDAALWQLDQTHKLCRTIQQDGGLIHPIIVYDNKVLEGNTRLCCFRHLYENEKNEKWRRIQCKIITQPITQDNIYRLLCSEHIEGKTEWDAWEKAHFFCKMKAEGKTLEQIKQLTKVAIPTILYHIDAYNLMIESGVHEKDKFSYFDQIVRSKDIREIEEKLDPEFKKKVIVKVTNGSIGRAESIRSIGIVWKHKDVRKIAFSPETDFEEVLNEVKVKAPMTASMFMKQTEDLLKRIEKLERDERDALKLNNTDKSKIKSLTKELIDLCNELEIKIHIPKSISN